MFQITLCMTPSSKYECYRAPKGFGSQTNGVTKLLVLIDEISVDQNK